MRLRFASSVACRAFRQGRRHRYAQEGCQPFLSLCIEVFGMPQRIVGVEGDDVQPMELSQDTASEDVECGDIGEHRKAAGVFAGKKRRSHRIAIGAIPLRKVLPPGQRSWVKPSLRGTAALCRLSGTQWISTRWTWSISKRDPGQRNGNLGGVASTDVINVDPVTDLTHALAAPCVQSGALERYFRRG